MPDVSETSSSARSPEPTAQRIVGEIRWLALGQAASQLTWLSMVVVLAAILPPRAFGTVAAGLAIVGVATLIMQSGTGGSIIASRMLSWAQVRGAVLLNLVVGVALTGLIAVLAQPLTDLVAQGSDPDVLRALGLSVTIVALSVVPTALVRKALNFKRLAAISVVAALVTSVIAIVAVLLGAGVWALVLRQIVFQLLVACFAWVAARELVGDLRRSESSPAPRLPPQRRLSFLIVSASNFLALSIDNLLVGASTSTAELGFYALAFTLGFAPLTQFSWQLGTVLFPAAAATHDVEMVGRRTVAVIRILGLMLLPLVPPAIVLAPVILPAILGPEWKPMVVPFQILIVVGVSHAVYNTIAESLSGTGNVRFRARVESAWAAATFFAVFALVQLYGIQGAAAAHLLVFIPLAWVYIVKGTRRIGTDRHRLWLGLREVAMAVGVQGVLTFGLSTALHQGGVGAAAAAFGAAAVGFVAAVALLWRAPTRPLREGRAVFAMALSRARTAN